MWQTHTYHFSFTIGSSSHHSYLFPLAGFGAGLAVFASGFRDYRKLRIIENTPRIAVRAAPMGLVHVHGKVTGHDALTSPITGAPCYYYEVKLQRWENQGKNKGWNTVHTAKDRHDFYLDDGTGKVLIDGQGGEFDLPCTYRGEFGPEAKSGAYIDPSLGRGACPSEQDLRAYAAKADPAFTIGEKTIAQLDAKYAQSTSLTHKIAERQKQVLEAQNPLTGHGSYRITEHCVVAEHAYDIIGTCMQNPHPQDDQDRNLIRKGENERTFVISGFSELSLEKILRKRSLTKIILGGSIMVITMGIIISELASP